MNIDNDIHALTTPELIVEWHDPTIDLRNTRLIPDIRMDRVGEIDRCRSLRKGNDITLRREYEYLVIEYIHLHLIHESSSFVHGFQDILDSPYPIGFMCLGRMPFL
jgi:hypothetical protein